MKNFLKLMVDPGSGVSAPQCMGVVLIFVFVVLSLSSPWFIFPEQLWNSLTILIPSCFFGGAAETYTQKRYGGVS